MFNILNIESGIIETGKEGVRNADSCFDSKI